ncbi:trehalose-6-phosphate synthase [Methanosarcinales archaeon ex4484_138]|nr:MAG: trehalose-6-phosphate synthase [Methanosarcinales archaeon ex4484_138]
MEVSGHSGELVIVTNREPYNHERASGGVVCKKTIGGVVSALDATMQQWGGTWIAWGSGRADFDCGDVVEVPCDSPKYRLKRVKLSPKDKQLYYWGFSNRTLWPVFHFFTERAVFSTMYWRAYQRANKKFASSVEEMAGPDSYVWVHDYHLSLVPSMIRSCVERIGFFWHIPWVPWGTFSKIPWRDEIFNGLIGSDLIGFHTKYHVRNFIECAEAMNYQVDKKRSVIHHEDRDVRIKAFPVGIDYQEFASEKTMPSGIRRKAAGDKIIFGIDRLDYTKGILERLLAFEEFLRENPEWHGKVTLLQVATPSRTRVEEYRLLKQEVERSVGRINGEYVALVTPIMDGMNLVVKEYIAAKKDLGVVILSEFAGAAEELEEAIIVNPYDIHALAESIKKALEMPEEEKKERFKALKGKVKKHDINWWMEKFFNEWEKIYTAKA